MLFFFFLSFPWYFLLLCDNFATSFVCIYRGTDRLLCTSTSHQSIERKKVVGPTSSMSFYFMCLIVVNTITSIIDMYNIEISQVPSTHCTPILFFNKKKKKNVWAIHHIHVMENIYNSNPHTRCDKTLQSRKHRYYKMLYAN